MYWTEFEKLFLLCIFIVFFSRDRLPCFNAFSSIEKHNLQFSRMEKFSNWRDKGTGIAPFIPLSAPKTPVTKYLVDPLLILVKFPFFIILYWFTLLAPKPAVKAIFIWIFRISTDVLVEGLRKLNKAEILRSLPDKNTVVVSNFSTPLDVFVIYLSSKVSSLSAVKVIVPIDSALYVLSAWQAAWLCFQPIGQVCGTKLTSQNEKTLANKLVVVFAEGTSSNNRALLSFSSVLEPIFALKGFSYQTMLLLWYPNTIPVPIPVVGPIQYMAQLFTLSSRPYVKVKITPNPQGSLKASKLAYQDNGVNMVDLGVAEKKKFYEYYQSQTK